MTRYLCFDVGGTTVKSGLLTEAGEILKTRNDPTPDDRDALLDLLERTAEGFSSEGPVGIGLATTGLVDPLRGEILPRSEPVKGYGGTPLRSELERRTGLPAEVENDVNCVLLGESWRGAAKGYQNAVCIAVGTGIGGALMIDGRLYRGSRFNAMEVGHIPFSSANRERSVRWEDLASTRALVRDCAELSGDTVPNLDGHVVAERARRGDPAALRALDGLCFHLAQGIATLFCTLAPDVFVLGGGISESMDLLRPRVEYCLERALDARFREGIALEAAKLGNGAGLVGALRHFLNMREHDLKERQRT